MKQKNSIAKLVVERITKEKGRYFADDNISQYISKDEIKQLILEVEEKVESLLNSLIIDTKNDPHTHETSHRIAKMLVSEVMLGRYQPLPRMKSFEHKEAFDNVLLLGPIKIQSMCSHHFVPVIGKLYIGIISDHQIWGISKFARISQWFMRRPHIQEKSTQDLADLILKLLQPKGLIIQFTAAHFCMSWRGVNEQEFKMTTVAKRGLLNQLDYEQQFYQLLVNLDN